MADHMNSDAEAIEGTKVAINWTVRVKNKQFWASIIPAMLLLVQAIAALFGFAIDIGTAQGKLLAVVDAVFTVLVGMGIVVDPTTHGISDSGQAMGYDVPRRG